MSSRRPPPSSLLRWSANQTSGSGIVGVARFIRLPDGDVEPAENADMTTEVSRSA